jgi:hypothetical protein
MKNLLVAFPISSLGLLMACVPAKPTPWPWMPHMPSWVAPFWFLWFLIGLGIYFLPTIVALARGKKRITPLVLVNVFLGWTLVGWIVTLVWAFSPDK